MKTINYTNRYIEQTGHVVHQMMQHKTRNSYRTLHDYGNQRRFTRLYTLVVMSRARLLLADVKRSDGFVVPTNPDWYRLTGESERISHDADIPYEDNYGYSYDDQYYTEF